jgi:hypothetical protein
MRRARRAFCWMLTSQRQSLYSTSWNRHALPRRRLGYSSMATTSIYTHPTEPTRTSLSLLDRG